MSIATAISDVQERIRRACMNAGRAASDVDLLLATKTVSPERLREAIAAGTTLFGENRMQEFVPKAEALRDAPITWHFIGHLQTNKVRDAVRHAACVQSVDRSSLAKELDKELQKQGKELDILVEVNTSGEESKHGVVPEHVDELLQYIGTCASLRIRGFMTIGALSEDEDDVRACFRSLRTIRDRAIDDGRIPSSATVLSMGMSGDLELAVEEGSTMIRVGSAVFGQR